jgi:hypothetical protein
MSVRISLQNHTDILHIFYRSQNLSSASFFIHFIQFSIIAKMLYCHTNLHKLELPHSTCHSPYILEQGYQFDCNHDYNNNELYQCNGKTALAPHHGGSILGNHSFSLLQESVLHSLQD